MSQNDTLSEINRDIEFRKILFFNQIQFVMQLYHHIVFYLIVTSFNRTIRRSKFLFYFDWRKTENIKVICAYFVLVEAMSKLPMAQIMR